MSKGGAAPVAASGGGGSAFQTGMSTFASCNKAGSIPHFNKHLAKYPNDFYALYYRGVAHAIIGQPVEALRDFRQAERVSSGAEKEAMTAILQESQGNGINCRQILQRALQRYPDSGLLWHQFGNSLTSDKKFTEAKEAYQRAVALNYPFAFYSHCEMGKMYRREGNMQEAVHQFESAIRKCPTFTIAHLNLGEVLEEEGNTHTASSYFERAKTLNPVLFEDWEKGRRRHASYSGSGKGGATGGRGGAGDGRGGGGNGSGSDDDDDDDRPREIFDPESLSDPTWNYKYHGERIFKVDDYCYMRDKAGHAGSYWKKYEYFPSKLELFRSVTKYGEELVEKHESNKGKIIWKKDLVGYTRKKKS